MNDDFQSVFEGVRKTKNLELNLRRLPALKAAKTAIVTLLRAAKKNNFLLLSLDHCPEIDTI